MDNPAYQEDPVQEMLEPPNWRRTLFRLRQRGPKTTRRLFPEAIQKVLDSQDIVKHVTVITPDYDISFSEDLCGEHWPEMSIQSSRFRIPSESYKRQTTKELAEYAAKRVARRGFTRFMLNILPDALYDGSIKSEDFFHDHFSYPLKMWWKMVWE